MEKEKPNLTDLMPKFTKGTWFVTTADGKQLPATQVTDVTKTGYGTYQFTRHWGGIVSGISYHCLCGCGEIQEMGFKRGSKPRGEWNGRFDAPQVVGEKISIIDGFWAMTYE
jgi:hypothetical protein